MQDLTIKTQQLTALHFPADLLNFIVCQFRFDLARKPYIVQQQVDSLWRRLCSAFELFCDTNAHFYLTPEYTLPFARLDGFIKRFEQQATNNSVCCVPVEHLTLDRLAIIAERFGIARDELNQLFGVDLSKVGKYTRSIFNVAVIAIKDTTGKSNFFLQPKLFPAVFEESRYIPGYSFQGGRAITVFQSASVSFAVSICFDWIGWGQKIPNALIEWLAHPGNRLDLLFVLQVNPTPQHRDFERALYHFANNPVCRHTTVFYVNCDSDSVLKTDEGSRIQGFNRTAIVSKFKLDYTNEYRVESTLEVPKDKFVEKEILQLDRFQRMVLLERGERVVWLRTRPLHNWTDGASYPRTNDLKLFSFRGKSLVDLSVRVIYEQRAISNTLPELPSGIYRPITVTKPPIFFGRKDELSYVTNFLKGRGRRLLISGEPGIGKSALAQYAVASVLESDRDRFSAGLWFSSRDRQLDIKNFLNQLTVDLNYPYLQQLDEVEQRSEIKHLLRKVLRRKALIVIDNYETITDSDLIEFIDDLAQESKVILTSRPGPRANKFVLYRLPPLNKADMELLARHVRPGLTQRSLDLLCTSLHGSPFGLQLLLGYLTTVRTATLERILETIGESGKSTVDWILAEAWNSVGKNGQRLLTALQLFADTFTAEAIKPISGLTGHVVDPLLKRLRGRCVIEAVESADQAGLRYQIHPLVRKLSEQARPGRATVLNYVKFYGAFVAEHIVTENFANVEKEIRNVERALDLSLAFGKPRNYLRILSKLYYYYYENGLWNEVIARCIGGYAQARKIGDLHFAVECSARVSWCAFRKEDFKLARSWLNKALNAVRASGRTSSQLLGFVEETKARLYHHDRKIELAQAEAMIAKSIALYANFDDPQSIILRARAETYLGELYLEHAEYQRAIEKFAKVLQLADENDKQAFATKMRAWTLGNLGEALLFQINSSAVRRDALEISANLFQEGLLAARTIERQHTIAHCCLGLGATLTLLGRREGKSFLSAANYLYQRLGKQSKMVAFETKLSELLPASGP